MQASVRQFLNIWTYSASSSTPPGLATKKSRYHANVSGACASAAAAKRIRSSTPSKGSKRNNELWPTVLQQPQAEPMPCDAVRRRVGAALYDCMKDYQQDAMQFLMGRGGRGLLSLEMGMGKTMVAVSCMHAMSDPAKAVLILCPAKVCKQFADAVFCWMLVAAGCQKSQADAFVRSAPCCWHRVHARLDNGNLALLHTPHTLPRDRDMARVRTLNASDWPLPLKGVDGAGSEDVEAVGEGVTPACYAAQEQLYSRMHELHKQMPTAWRVCSRWFVTSYEKARALFVCNPSRSVTPSPCSGEFGGSPSVGYASRSILRDIGGLVCDESQRLKCVNSGITRAVTRLSRVVPHVVLLSGIPLNRPLHLFSQINIVRTSGLGPFHNEFLFKQRYCNPVRKFINQHEFRWTYNGASHTEELHTFMCSHIMFRRTKEQVVMPSMGVRVDMQQQHAMQQATQPQATQQASSRVDYTKVHSRTVKWVKLQGRAESTRLLDARRLEQKHEELKERDREWASSRQSHLVQEAAEGAVDAERMQVREMFMRVRRQTALDKVRTSRAWLVQRIREHCFPEQAADEARHVPGAAAVAPPKLILFAVHLQVMTELESIVQEALACQGDAYSEGQNKVPGRETPSSTKPPQHEMNKYAVPEVAFDPAAAYVHAVTANARRASDPSQPSGPSSGPSSDRRGYGYIRVDGSSGRATAEHVHRFHVDPRCCVAILSTLAASAGLEMQPANLVLFVELSFNADDLLQAEARSARIGQTRPVHVEYLLARNTVEVDVFQIVKSKLRNISQVLGATPCQIHTDT